MGKLDDVAARFTRVRMRAEASPLRAQAAPAGEAAAAAAARAPRAARLRGLASLARLPEASGAGAAPGGAGLAAPADGAEAPLLGFSDFDPAHRRAASRLALALSAIAANAPTRTEGLEAAAAAAEAIAPEAHPQLLERAVTLFLVHDRNARRLPRTRTLATRPALFAPSRRGPPPGPAGPPAAATASGAEIALDFWREDPLANEHHEHWHVVYPGSGRLPGDWNAWVETTPRPILQQLFERMDPTTSWAPILASETTEQVKVRFLALWNSIPDLQGFFDGLTNAEQRALFGLGERHGEMFVYMHQQMLARYRAERRCAGLAPLVPFGPAHFAAQIPEAYDPGAFLSAALDLVTDPANRFFYRPRAAGAALGNTAVQWLAQQTTRLAQAAQSGSFRALPQGATLPATPENMGRHLEAVDAGLAAGMDAGTYAGLHNQGHVFLSRLRTLDPARPPGNQFGVMIDTRTAIRDPIFWRWHRHVDDLNVQRQDRLPPYDFSDAPDVRVRHGLAGAPGPWTSPDLVFCRRADLPGGLEPDFDDAAGNALGEALFGGAAWDTDFRVGEAVLPDGTRVPTTDALETRLDSGHFPVLLGGDPAQTVPITYLTHEPFSWFVRLENPGPASRDVVVRAFLVPEADAEDRRAWIEMDKFVVRLAPQERRVVHRSDDRSSVVKKPVDRSPTSFVAATDSASGDDPFYCDCGWPWTLLLPRGTTAGLACRFVVFLTDAALDLLPDPGMCGSLSFCGALERYPDTRDLGWPFSRPFATTIETQVHALASAAGRTLRIVHAGGPNP